MKSPNEIASARRVIGASVFWWVLVLVLFSWVAAILPRNRPPEFWRTIRDHDVSGAWMGVVVMALSWALTPLFARCDWARIAAFIERNLLVLCGLGFVLYAAISYWPQQHFTFSWDEYSLLTQSRIFATGHISSQVPPDLLNWAISPGHRGRLFAVSAQSGHFVPVYWPGVGLLATPFTALGVSWLCNPFLGALGLWGVHRLTLRVSGSREAAAWAWLLMLASPVVALNAATLYAMPAHLLFNVFYCLLLLRDDRRGALGAGLVGGFALILHNPVPHLAFALPWLFYVATKRRRLLAPLVAGYLVFALPLGLGWSRYIGASFDVGQYASHVPVGSASSPFAEMLGRLPTVFNWPSLYVVLSRFGGLAKTVVWAVPGLLVVAWLGWRTLARQGSSAVPTDSPMLNRRAMRLLAASFIATFLIYFMVSFDQTLGWGFRYIHPAWFVLPVLGATFLACAPNKSVLRPFFAALCVLTLALSLPLRAIQADHLISFHRAQIPTATASASITFINVLEGSFSFDLLHNDPFLRNDDWRFVDRGANADAQVARKYLVNPKRERSGKWGEIWTGSALRHPPFLGK